MLRFLDKPNTVLGFLALYFFYWVVFPTLATSSYPLDVIEGIVWGQEWQWGYYKHPPLPSWLLYSFFKVFGQVGPYLLSQLSLAISLWFVYCLAKVILPPSKAFFAAILLLASFYYTWPSLEYNHNIAQLPLWAAITYVYYQAIRTNQVKLWLVFGLLGGLGLLTKYTTAILLLCLLFYTLTRPYRFIWRSYGVWLSLISAMIVFLPHLNWLYTHDWLPFEYALGRAESHGFWSGRLTSVKFLGAQFINHLPLLLILLFSAVAWKMRRFSLNLASRFVIFIALAPALLTALIGLLLNVKLHDMWGMPMWNYSGILLMLCLPDNDWEKTKQRLIRGWFIWLVIVTLLMLLYVYFGAGIRQKNARIDWPQQALAAKVRQQWASLSKCPLKTITGEYWLAGLVIVGQQRELNRPSLLLGGSSRLSPWVAAADIKQSGTLVVWQDEVINSPYLTTLSVEQFVIAQGQWQFIWPKQPKAKPLTVRWRAYVPRACRKNKRL